MPRSIAPIPQQSTGTGKAVPLSPKVLRARSHRAAKKPAANITPLPHPTMLALSVAMAAALLFPTTAFAKVVVDEQELAQGGNSVGGGMATLSEAVLDMVDVTASTMHVDQNLAVNFNGGNSIEDLYIEGSANVEVNYTGENGIEDTHVTDQANATINANGHNEFEEIKAYNNANVTVNVTGENDVETIQASDNASVTVRGTDCQKRDIANVGEDEEHAGIFAENGNVVIDHVTVNLESKIAYVGSRTGSTWIGTSKIASSDGNEFAEVVAGKTMKVSESVLDIVGTVHADGKMTIVHSDIKAKAPGTQYDSSPYRIYSKAGIELIREKNGTIKEGKLGGNRVFFVDTGDGTDVDLKADGKPGYYACKDNGIKHVMAHVPARKTGDAADPWGLSMLALVGATTAGYAVRRRRDDKGARSAFRRIP